MSSVQINLVVPFAEYLLDEEDRDMKYIPHVIEHLVCHKIILFRRNSVYNAYVDQVQTCFQFLASSEMQANQIIEQFYKLDFADQSDGSLTKQLVRIDGEYFYSHSELADKIWEKIYGEKNNDMIGAFHNQKFVDDLCQRCIKYYNRFYTRGATKLFVKYENPTQRPLGGMKFGDFFYVPQRELEKEQPEADTQTFKAHERNAIVLSEQTRALFKTVRERRAQSLLAFDALRGKTIDLELEEKKEGSPGSVLVFDQQTMDLRNAPSQIVQYSVFVLFFYFMRV